MSEEPVFIGKICEECKVHGDTWVPGLCEGCEDYEK